MEEKKNKNAVEEDVIEESEAVSEEKIMEELSEPDISDGTPSELDKARADADSFKALALRTQADFDNYRKRNAELTKTSRADGKADAVTELLPVLDNFERAKNAIDDEKIKSGLEKIEKQFVDALAHLGVVEIEAKGVSFNPDLHNAVISEEMDGVDSGTVLEVLQKGYMLGKRVLRYSMVKVAK